MSGKYGRNKPAPQEGRIAQGGSPVPETVVQQEIFYNTIDALEEVAAEVGKNVAQVALNWLLQRPTVSSIIIGARNEEQLKQNLEAVGWNLTREQVEKLDKASEVPPHLSVLASVAEQKFKSYTGFLQSFKIIF
ncbi:aldo/keto reductase [Chryseobacterium sp. C39-AII1]|uniref:aldo/keto reductase n=1 Tax=Chryseobacterium sp. C39-AII1 TaxID=3080332 RepID=UPI00320921EA